MHIRSASSSAHVYGMSSLWHDVDYVPQKRFDVPTVHKGLDEMPLPSELHQKTADADPFQKQEQIYDVAAAQMERGIAGKHFLEGHRVDLDQKIGASQAIQNQNMDLKQIENREKASKNRQYGKVSNAVETKETQGVGDDSDLAASQLLQGVGMVAGMMTTAASQSVQGVQLPSAVKDTVAAVGSTVGAAETGAMTMTQTVLEDEAEDALRVKRRNTSKK